jgi:hypothetical protein
MGAGGQIFSEINNFEKYLFYVILFYVNLVLFYETRTQIKSRIIWNN